MKQCQCVAGYATPGSEHQRFQHCGVDPSSRQDQNGGLSDSVGIKVKHYTLVFDPQACDSIGVFNTTLLCDVWDPCNNSASRYIVQRCIGGLHCQSIFHKCGHNFAT